MDAVSEGGISVHLQHCAASFKSLITKSQRLEVHPQGTEAEHIQRGSSWLLNEPAVANKNLR